MSIVNTSLPFQFLQNLQTQPQYSPFQSGGQAFQFGQAIAQQDREAKKRAQLQELSQMMSAGRINPAEAYKQYDPAGAMKTSFQQSIAPQHDRILDDIRSTRNTTVGTKNALIGRGLWDPANPEHRKIQGTIDALDSEMRNRGIPIPIDQQPAPQEATATQSETDYVSAYEEAQSIIDSAVDKTGALGVPDGQIDDISKLQRALQSVRKKYNIPANSQEWNDVEQGLKFKQDEISGKQRLGAREEEKRYKRSIERKKEIRAEEQDKFKQDEKYQAIWKGIDEVKQEPSDTNKKSLINLVLRDETGAAIAADEFNNMMEFLLPESSYQSFKEETTGLNVILRGMINEQAKVDYLKQAANKYIGFVDPQRLSNYADRKIPAGYYRKKEKKASADRPRIKIEGWK